MTNHPSTPWTNLKVLWYVKEARHRRAIYLAFQVRQGYNNSEQWLRGAGVKREKGKMKNY